MLSSRPSTVRYPPGTTVQGNYIGTNAAGTAAIGNKTVGIQLSNGSNNSSVIGNLISFAFDNRLIDLR